MKKTLVPSDIYKEAQEIFKRIEKDSKPPLIKPRNVAKNCLFDALYGIDFRKEK